MSPKTFNGTSKKGDFHEALHAAIGAAKEGLTTDFVRWRLEKVSGENGGFILQNDLTVTIAARGPKKMARSARQAP